MSKHAAQVFCIPRSGSTLVNGILIDLVPDTPPQTHDLELLNCERMIVTYRDFRNAAASLWRVRHGKFDRPEHATRSNVSDAASCMDDVLRAAERMEKLRHEHILYLRYESFVGRVDRLVLLIADFIGDKREPGKYLHISDQWGTERVREAAARRDGWEDWDAARQIHGLHVYAGETDWRRMFCAESHEMVEKKLGAYCRRWGYD